MSAMNSLFAQLRESRAVSTTEPIKEEAEVNTEETQVEPVVESKEEEKPEVESIEEEVVSACFCEDCGALVSGVMNESEVDECPCCGSANLLEKEVKVVRDGKVVKKKVRTGAKPRISAAQKAALAKARKKAHTAAANKARAKSLKKGAAMGLHDDDAEWTCPECGYTGDLEEFDVNADGEIICPECGAVCECDTVKNESISTDKDETIEKMLEQVNAPQFVKDAFNEGKMDFVTGYINLKLGK